MTEQDVDESEQSSLEEPPEEETSSVPDAEPASEQLAPEQDRPEFDAADNSPAREPGAQGEPRKPGEHSAPTRPVTLPSAGGFGMLGFGG
ncbi:hypothetical protein M3F57_07975 [Brachybacterium muris]|uniref:hypothetical protein n=1 Tax=Brachybacterium muris TaxID=219301 RepID=UPI00223B8B00|nr:hypothetical protein [Brachybacterium muris]MCT2296073.1 hypothetical protein [Brachybacterium muris]